MKLGMFVKKKEMTKLVIDQKPTSVTLLSILPQVIVDKKTVDRDGYDALVIGGGDKKQLSYKSGKSYTSYQFLGEFGVDDISSFELNQELGIDLIKDIKMVSLTGTSKGKGFQGYVKRFHAAGMPATHGHKYTKHGGSIGNRKPRRTQKGHPNPGRMGGETVTLNNRPLLDIVEINNETIMIVKGSVPGCYNGILKVSFVK